MLRKFGIAAAILAVYIGIVIARNINPSEPRSSGAAPIPAVFAEKLTLAQAEERAKVDGRPVLAFATADWCGPCQSFKKAALIDPAVEAAIRERTVPAYVDIDVNKPDAARLAVQGVPSMVLMRDGKAVAKMTGARPAADVLAWLNQEAGPK